MKVLEFIHLLEFIYLPIFVRYCTRLSSRVGIPLACFSDENLFRLAQITSTIIIKISVALKYYHSTVQGGSKGGVILNDLYHKRLR